jgi:fused signal recognition particle receptor
MFGKIKNKLKNLFGSEDGDVQDVENIEELENIEDEMLEGVESQEVEAIKEHRNLPKDVVGENIEELEKKEEVEDKLEKETVSDIENANVDVEKEIESSDIEEELNDETDILEESEKEKKGFFGKVFGSITSKTLTESDFEKIWEELEIFLLEINIAYEIVAKIEEKLRSEIVGNSFDRFSLTKSVKSVLISEVQEVLLVRESNFIEEIKTRRSEFSNEPVKIMILGVNGTGKTTTIAKLCKLFEKNGLSLVVAAADTFRAAAVEQLEEHSNKVGFKLIKHIGGSDPAAVGFDAINHAKAKNLDVVIVDTAGRMPNNSNLMNELKKIERVCKIDYSIFVGDSVSGNDLMEQIELFDKIVDVDGIILTKTDTDERPGSVVTAAYSIEKPIYFLGVGQSYDDLVEFNSKEVSEKLFELD